MIKKLIIFLMNFFNGNKNFICGIAGEKLKNGDIVYINKKGIIIKSYDKTKE